MASLVDQIFQQSQAGSANGESFFDAYLAGKQGAQRDRQLAVQEQQLNATLAQLPLHMTLQRQEADLNQYKLTDLLQQRENYVSSTGAFTNLSERISPMLEDGQLDEALRAHALAGAQNNFLLTDPRYKAMGTQLTAMQKEADLAAYRLALGEAATQRAEASKARADVATSNLALSQAKLELDKLREQRLREQFDHKVKQAESSVPQVNLAIFRERAAQIRSDITLLGDPAKAAAKLDEIVNELRGVAPAPATTTNAPSSGFKIKVIKP